jgi:hypothetical protein
MHRVRLAAPVSRPAALPKPGVFRISHAPFHPCRAALRQLNSARYWAFHPYPQRSFSVELKYDH